MLSREVESYKFWDVAAMWARERLEHEDVVARALAKGIVRDGLRFQSLDPRWVTGQNPSLELRGYPYVGYCPNPGGALVVLRAQVLEHLLAVVLRAEVPSRTLMTDEFVTKTDFASWISITSQAFPSFWFVENDRAVGT